MDQISFFLGRTFLIERSLGILTYVIVIGFTYISLRQSKSFFQFNRALNICLVVLCIMAFFYVPAETADLFRIRSYIKSWESMTYSQWANIILTNTNAPGAFYLYFLMSRIKIPGLLPALTCFVVFGNIFHILKEERRIERSSSKTIALAFFYLMAQGIFLGVISGIRNAMAFSLVARATYDDFCLNKNRVLNYLLCLIAVSLHISAIPVVAIYLVFTIYHNWREKRFASKIFSFIVVLGVIYWAIHTKAGIIDVVISKAEIYSKTNVYSYIWEQIIVYLAFILLVVILVSYRKYYKAVGLNTIYIIASFLACIVIMLIGSYTMFHRFANYVMYISLPIIANCLEHEIANNRSKLYNSLKLISFLIFALVCIRGDLCGYKFFLL